MHIRMSGGSAAMALGCMASAACAVAPPEEADPGELGTVSAAIKVCPDWGCGENSPQIGSFGFFDLSVATITATGRPSLTEPNAAGLSIRAVRRRAQIVAASGDSYDLRVVDGHIIGSVCRTSCSYLEGQALVGATIALQGSKGSYSIAIDGVRTLDYFRGPGQTEAYRLTWQEPGGKPVNLCNNIPFVEQSLVDQGGGTDGEYGKQELMGLDPNEAVVFEGDRFDAVARTMSSEADDRWFNIGCAASALAKLRLTHNTIHSQAAGLPRAWQQRQATLKMFAADYCGTGQAFTVGGQRLVWKGDEMVDYFSKPLEVEARWTERGAMCLNQPRMLYPTSALGASTFPDIVKMVQQACKVVSCKNLDPDDFAGADRISANPILPVP